MVTTIVIYHFLILSFILFFLKRGKRLSNTILAVFLLVKGLSLLGLELTPFIRANPAFIIFFKPLLFFYMPVVWLYVLSHINKPLLLDYRRHYIHFLPGVLYVVYLSVKYFAYQQGHINSMFHARDSLYISSLYYIQTIGYLIYSIYYIQSKNNAYFSTKTIVWLRNILIGLLCIWVVFFVRFISYRLGVSTPYDNIISTSCIILLLLFVNMIVVYGIKEPDLFVETRVEIEKTESSQDNEEFALLTNQLHDYMKMSKAFLNPDINLDMLAKALRLHPRLVTKMIKKSAHQNFYTYINTLRIEEAKSQLADITNSNTVLEILYDVGFNNKSVFYTNFKNNTGLTPTQFRKSRQQEQKA